MSHSRKHNNSPARRSLFSSDDRQNIMPSQPVQAPSLKREREEDVSRVEKSREAKKSKLVVKEVESRANSTEIDQLTSFLQGLNLGNNPASAQNHSGFFNGESPRGAMATPFPSPEKKKPVSRRKF